MVQEEEGFQQEAVVSDNQKLSGTIQITKSSLITILICTGMSMIFMNNSLLFLFFLVPLGYSVLATGSFLPTFISISAANLIYSIIVGRPFSSVELFSVLLLYTPIFLGYTWVMGGKKLKTSYRLILMSFVCAAAFLIFINNSSSRFYEYYRVIAEEVYSVIAESADESDNLRNTMYMRMLDPDNIVEMAKSIFFRGGALFTMIFLLFINRQIACSVFWIIKRKRKVKSLSEYFAPPNAIWVFLAAIISIIMMRSFKVEILEILAWNVFIICGMIFLAQGAGVFIHWLSKLSFGIKIAASIALFIFVLSPFSFIAVGALLLLGVIENWIPFRLGKSVQ